MSREQLKNSLVADLSVKEARENFAKLNNIPIVVVNHALNARVNPQKWCFKFMRVCRNLKLIPRQIRGILKRFDYGFNGTAGFEGKNVLFSVNYGLGLAKLQSGENSSTDDKNKHRVLSFTVGFSL